MVVDPGATNKRHAQCVSLNRQIRPRGPAHLQHRVRERVLDCRPSIMVSTLH